MVAETSRVNEEGFGGFPHYSISTDGGLQWIISF